MEMVDIKTLITNEFPLAGIKEAFELVDKDDTAIKVILRP
jgi:L-iditol 2-dehydrogenase